MKRILPIVIAVVAAGSPIGARAGSPCQVLYDPVGDVSTAFIASEHAQRFAAIDLTGVWMRLGERSLEAIVGVRDLASSPGPAVTGATYAVTWRAGDRRVTATAMRSGASWSFGWRDDARNAGDAGGIADPVNGEVTIAIPLSAATDGADGALTDVRATSNETVAGLFGSASDRAPNSDGGPRDFPLDGSCASSTQGLGRTCDVLGLDPNTDAGDRAPLLRSVGFAAADRNIVVRFHAPDLAASFQDETGARVEVGWFNPRLYEGDERQTASVQRVGERIEFGYARGSRQASAIGWVDEHAGTATVLVPRAHLDLTEGTRLGRLHASGWRINGTVHRYDGALPASSDDDPTWVVGNGCAVPEVHVCPVVLDRAGDARYLEVTDEVPENYASLDLLAAGAAPSGDEVVLSVSVGDLDASYPPGAEVIGWTISWLDGERRIYAQAELYPEGPSFRYGARAAGREAPAGPTFTGTATTGRLDAASDRVEVRVPRRLMPADGTLLPGFGATAWALSGRNSGSAYLVWDETVARAYRAGIACPA